MKPLINETAQAWFSGGWIMLPLLGTGIAMFFLAGSLWRFLRVKQKESAQWDSPSRQLEILVIESAQRRIAILQVLVATGPLLGLLGTVLGMLATFQAMGASDGNTAQYMAEGISKALTTTEVGLLIAAAGYFFLASFQTHVLALQARIDQLRINHPES